MKELVKTHLPMFYDFDSEDVSFLRWHFIVGYAGHMPVDQGYSEEIESMIEEIRSEHFTSVYFEPIQNQKILRNPI